MDDLYVPILEEIYGVSVVTLQACQTIRYIPKHIRSPEELYTNPEFGLKATWQFIH